MKSTFEARPTIDVVGVDQSGWNSPWSDRAITAFHEAGLNYGGGADKRVLKKLLRTMITLDAYHPSETARHIYFVSPKVNPGVQLPLKDIFSRLREAYVPQLVRYGTEISGNRLENDPFGQGFLERIAATNSNTRQSRLNKIARSLARIVPQLAVLTFERDPTNGQPHLRARFDNWRTNDVWQREDQLSDGTLRLIGLFWSLLERSGVLLLEEPEISLNRDIVRRLAGLIYALSAPVRRRRGDERHREQRQVILTTHSPDLLCDQGIDGWEVLFITPSNDGSILKPLADDPSFRHVLEAGVMPGEIAPFRDQAVQLPMDLGIKV